MSVRIVTDSSSDITQAEARALGITVVPLKVIFDDTEYRDGIDITNEEFYQKLKKSKKLPTTTQPSAMDFQEAFEEAPEDEIVAVLLASQLSGTVQSAMIARESVSEKNIFIVDSLSATLGLRILVMRAIQLIEEGLSGVEIANVLDKERKELILLAVVDTLSYLHKGGRLSKTAALAGGLLGVKPVITLSDGKLEVLGKERGLLKAFAFLRDTAEGMGELDSNRPHSLGYTATSESLEAFSNILGKDYAPDDAIIDSIGSSIGTHGGPGAIAVAYFKK
ncbi:MAG: DegV family protein [Clostridiaceae bacterium]|nr:DegV family protein [Clostridiaceae bacterium]